MKFAVDAWDPSYGGGTEGGGSLVESDAPVRLDAEVAEAAWAPRLPAPGTPAKDDVLFVDGVRRVEARVWVAEPDGSARLGLAASYGAGVVRCNGRAELVEARVERRLLTSASRAEPIETRHGRFALVTTATDDPDTLSLALQGQMGALEAEVAHAAVGDRGDDALVVVDGPLRQQGRPRLTVGSIKTQHRSYGGPVVQGTVARLAAGERTPVFVIGEPFPRWSWYVRLPGAVSHPLAALVRCEADAGLSTAEAATLADRITALLPRFASEPHKDPRAPQNLYPIAGLERELRRRLGDPALMLRALRVAAGPP